MAKRWPRMSRRMWSGLAVIVVLLWLGYLASAFGSVGVSRARGGRLDPMNISGPMEGKVVGLSSGYLFLVVQDDPDGGTADWQWSAFAHRLPPKMKLGPWTGVLGFSSHDYGGLRGYALTGLWPCGVSTGLLALLRPRKEIKEGYCACGYDLRATPAQCPECGRVTVRAGVG